MNEVDKIFRDAFADARIRVDDSIWSNIQTKISGKNKVRRLAIWMLTAILLIIMAYMADTFVEKYPKVDTPEVKTNIADTHSEIGKKLKGLELPNDETTSSAGNAENIHFLNIRIDNAKNETTGVDNFLAVELNYSEEIADADPVVAIDEYQDNISLEAIEVEYRQVVEISAVNSLQLAEVKSLSPIGLAINFSDEKSKVPKDHTTDVEFVEPTLAEKVLNIAGENTGKLAGRIAKSSAFQEIFSLFD